MTGLTREWKGAAALQGGKGYARCALGDLHYRVLSASAAGAAKPLPILLLHQTPFGLAEWVDIQPLLAQAGHDTIAVDNPGYGMSDAPPAGVTVAQLADNFLGLLDHLGIEAAIVAGHHTGAALAAALAARHAARVAALVLQGCPLYTAAERAERLQRSAPDFTPREDGGHLANLFRAIHAASGRHPDALVATTWATLGAALAGAHTPTYRAVFANDMAPDIARIRAPTMILTDRADSLSHKDREVSRLRPDFDYREFSSGGSFALMLEPRRWVDTVLAFTARASDSSR